MSLILMKVDDFDNFFELLTHQVKTKTLYNHKIRNKD